MGGKRSWNRKKQWVMVEQEENNQLVLTSLVNLRMKKWNPSVHHPSGLVYWWVLVRSGHMVHVQTRALHSGRVFGVVCIILFLEIEVQCTILFLDLGLKGILCLIDAHCWSCSLSWAGPATNEAAKNGAELVDCCKLHFFLALHTKARILCLDSL